MKRSKASVKKVLDPQVLAQLDTRINQDAWSKEQFLASLSGSCQAWGLSIETGYAGFALVMLAGDEMELLKIGILPEYQHQGYGKVLLKQMIIFGKALSLSACYLEVRASNIVAQSFYEKLGFDCLGTRKNYYPSLIQPGQYEDAKLYTYRFESARVL